MRYAMVASAYETGGPCYKARGASAAAAGSALSEQKKKQVVGWVKDKTQKMCNLYVSELGLMLQVPVPGIK